MNEHLAQAYKRAFEAARAYIDKCPCDPDIYPDQWAAWQKYEQEEESLNIALRDFEEVDR